MIPQFKQGGPTEKTRWYPPQIVSLAPEFTVAADRFCEYAHRLYALPIVHGEGGIVLEKDGARAPSERPLGACLPASAHGAGARRLLLSGRRMGRLA